MEMICSLVTVRLGLNLQQPERLEVAGWSWTSHVTPQELDDYEGPIVQPSDPNSGTSQLCELGQIICIF